MKLLLIAISFCCFNSLAYAQKPDKDILDHVRIRAYYLLAKKTSPSTPAYRRDTMVLDIGKQVSKFYDPARLGRDSAMSQLMNGKREDIKSLQVFKGDKGKDLSNLPGMRSSNAMEGESYQILKEKQGITVFDYLSGAAGAKLQYEDPFPKLNWELVEGTDTVATYACQKALLKFRGRNYTAWFSPDIPVNEGPWKFSGLPGLILKIEDADQLFSFTLIGMIQPKSVLPIILSKADFLKCSREDFTQRRKKQGMGMQLHFADGVLSIAELPGKYDPLLMELE
ncbi:GLPGLI family protein [Pedobacter sp. PLR]|uniref:GLPGLI family protein n=1 Tax=Pedobacter sp. PLR TaxID=2994465 RepID=UPI002245A01E|nr:GLPGLI family protein [Pedobacter sp. PLR]MCX2452538.1 GLPGLI family protein [Pedobacter sp. PLR]